MSSGPPSREGGPPLRPVALPMQLKSSTRRTWADVAQGKSAQPLPSEATTPAQPDKKPSTAPSTALSSTAGATSVTGTTGPPSTGGLSGVTPVFKPKTTDKDPPTPGPDRFRANGNLLTNHFQVQFGNAHTIYEYSLNIVQVHSAPPGHNPTIISRIRRRVVYLFTQELMHGAVTTLPTNPPQPPGNPSTGSDTQTPANGSLPQTAGNAQHADPSIAPSGHAPVNANQVRADDKRTQHGACEGKPAVVQESSPGDSTEPSVPQPILENTLIASDYHDTLVTLTSIPDQYLGVAFRLNYYEDWENGPSNNPMQFRITMSLVNRFRPQEVIQQLASAGQVNVAAGTRNSFLRAFNIMFSHRSNLRTFQDIPRGRTQTTAQTSTKKFFDLVPSNLTNLNPAPPWQLNVAMDALPGYFLSSRAVINAQLLLNVNTMTSAFYKPFLNLNIEDPDQDETLDGLIAALYAAAGTHSPPSLREIQGHLKGVRVRTKYLVASGAPQEKHYSITGIPIVGNQWQTAGNVNTSVLDQVTQQPLTVDLYFQQRHPHTNIVAGDRLINSGRSTIPAKLLQVLRGSPVKQKTDMVRHAARRPTDNRQMIMNDGKTLFGFIPVGPANTQQPALLFEGITIDQRMLNVAARMLKNPHIGYAANQALTPRQAQTGNWNLVSRRFIVPYQAPLGEFWSYVQLRRGHSGWVTHSNDLRNWAAEASRSLGRYGVAANLFEYPGNGLMNQHHLQVTSQQSQTNVTQDEVDLQTWIVNLEHTLAQAHNGSLKLLFVLLPERLVPLYALVKRIADQTCGIRTICHVMRGGRQKPPPRTSENPAPVPNQGGSAVPGRGGSRAQPWGHSPGQGDAGGRGRDDSPGRGDWRGRGRGPRRGRGGGGGGGHETYWGPDCTAGFLANLFMKFNVKANENGANQALLTAAPILDDDTMLMGADVTHAGAGAIGGAPSIAAVVGSIDGNFSQFPASLSQNERQVATGNHKHGLPNEEILGLAEMVRQRIEAYTRRRNKFPLKVIFYRDGLSEEQLDMCQQNELREIRQGIQQARVGAWKDAAIPHVTLICTIKRHHARFFPDPTKPRLDTNMFFPHGNPLPGCMVSDSITLDKGKGDFFLVSHEALQGTARPTHYVVLANDNNEHLNDIACMTNSLCYLFQRATRSVGLAPPSYYADLAADRARHYVRDIYAPFPANQGVNWNQTLHPLNLSVHLNLRDNMFYI